EARLERRASWVARLSEAGSDEDTKWNRPDWKGGLLAHPRRRSPIPASPSMSSAIEPGVGITTMSSIAGPYTLPFVVLANSSVVVEPVATNCHSWYVHFGSVDVAPSAT